MFPIASVTLTSAGGVNFTSIPQTFTHLQLRIFARTERFAAANDYFVVRPNSDSVGSTYFWHNLSGDGSSATSTGTTGQLAAALGWLPGASATANVFGNLIVDFLDYTNTNKYKTIKSIGGFDGNGSGNVTLSSGTYPSLTAITSILMGGNIANFIAGSRADLYGIQTSNATGA